MDALSQVLPNLTLGHPHVQCNRSVFVSDSKTALRFRVKAVKVCSKTKSSLIEPLIKMNQLYNMLTARYK